MDYTESDRIIHAGFPHLFAPEKPIKVEFGPGWIPLCFALCEELEAMWEAAPPPKFHIATIREKFGVLRIAFCVPSGDPLMSSLYQLTHRYVKRSSETCELCGGPGVLIDQPWQRVRCALCRT